MAQKERLLEVVAISPHSVRILVRDAHLCHYVDLPHFAWDEMKDDIDRDRLAMRAMASPHASLTGLRLHPSTRAVNSHLDSNQKRVRRDWLETFSFFLPKSVREPWLGDLREDRKAMADAGRSQRFIQWATLVQLGLLLLHSAH